MKILIVASYKNGGFAPFVAEQAEALRKAGCAIEWFGVQRKGLLGYVREIPRLREVVRSYGPDVVHAHYGLSGLLANLATRRVPVVTTYHGSDVNEGFVRVLSRAAMRLSKWNIFVSKRLMEKAQGGERCSVIPCGVDLPKAASGRRNRKKVLFAGAFDNEVKDAALAFESMKGVDAELMELKGYEREEVVRLLGTVGCVLMTSKNEGSPQVIKEALVCGCPIVSVDVGDVKERVEGVKGCWVVFGRAPEDLRAALALALALEGETNGREKIIKDGLTNEQIAKKIVAVYESVVSR